VLLELLSTFSLQPELHPHHYPHPFFFYLHPFQVMQTWHFYCLSAYWLLDKELVFVAVALVMQELDPMLFHQREMDQS